MSDKKRRKKNTGAIGCTLIDSFAGASNSGNMEINLGGDRGDSTDDAHRYPRPEKRPRMEQASSDEDGEENTAAEDCHVVRSTLLAENKKDLKIDVGTPKGSGSVEVKRNAFISDNSVALLLRGWGEDAAQDEKLKNTMNSMKQLLITQADMQAANMVEVVTSNEKNGTTRGELLDAIDNIKGRLKGANFLFYFIGHNNKDKGGLQLQKPGGRDAVLKYSDLKEALQELQCPYKLFILDTCFSSHITLKPGDDEESMKEEEEHLAPPLWEQDDDEAVKIQWNSAKADQFAYITEGFTWAINDVISNPSCPNVPCLDLRRKVPRGGLARVEELNGCVLQHLKIKQENGFRINKPERLADFPAFSRLKY